MAYSIGSLNFAIMQGVLQPTGETVEDITRPGIHGHAFRLHGKRNPPSMVRTFADAADAAAAELLMASYRAAIGTVVTVSDSRESSIENVIVLDCRIVSARYSPIVVGGSGNSGIVVIADWTLQRTEVD